MVEVSPDERITNNIVHNDGRIADPNVRGIYISESENAFVAFNTVITTADSRAFQAMTGARGDFGGLVLLGNIFASYGSTAGTVADVGLHGPNPFTSDWNIFYRQTGGFQLERDGVSLVQYENFPFHDKGIGFWRHYEKHLGVLLRILN